jgi:two-component system, chemotaxis family, protein-glutamate methylesterase/glutaminase
MRTSFPRVRKLILFGGSAGGIQALGSVLEGLPADLAAAAMAVIHTTEESQFLPSVLARRSKFKVMDPEKSQPLQSGRLYLPQPGRHLVVKSNCAVSRMGPRENRHRPAVDTLFRSAARAYRSHVIAVVLSGALDDGSAGALAVKARGGIVIVQDPAEALVKDMPRNVMRQVKTDYCLPAREISLLLTELASKGPALKLGKVSSRHCDTVDYELTTKEREPGGLSCPECDGALMEIRNGKSIQLRCHVGHSFSLESFSEAHADALERALWIALRRLNEQRLIEHTLATAPGRDSGMKKRYLENSAAAAHDMRLLHESLARL